MRINEHLGDTMKTIALLTLLILGLATPSHATNSKPELMFVMQDLLAWLPGDYSSKPQVFLETELGEPPSGLHDDWYRSFAMIEAPHIGETVMYTQIRLGAKDGPLYPGQQVLFIITMDEENAAVNISGRRLLNMEEFEDLHLKPELWDDVQIDPEMGGNCDFRWRRHGRQLVGVLEDGECTMTSKNTGQLMTWKAEWVLNDEELWIHDNGYYEDGSLIAGRPDKTHLRLYKVREHECFVSLMTDKNEPQVINGFTMHDRGDQFTFMTEDIEPRMLYLDFMRSLWPSRSGRNFVDLARLTLYEGDPEDDEPDVVLGNAWSQPMSDRVGFGGVMGSARCKRPS